MRSEWMTIVRGIRPHFSKAYLLEPEQVHRGVNRPNHSIHHGLRQGFLALDICTIFSKNCFGWLSEELQNYPDSYYYIQAISCFQRSGRESESNDPEINKRFLEKDKANFESWAGEKFSKVDTSVYDDNELSMIGRIVKAAHQLDLRRIVCFDKQRIKKEVYRLLFLGFCNECVKSKVFEELWRRSGEYLRVTGDRDMDKNKSEYSHHFVDLNNDPDKLVDELIGAQMLLRR